MPLDFEPDIRFDFTCVRLNQELTSNISTGQDVIFAGEKRASWISHIEDSCTELFG